MNDEKKCNRYEGFFVFQDEEKFYEHLEHCPDCQKEHEKYIKVSELVKEVAPLYLKKKQKEKIGVIKKLACCFVVFVGLTAFTGYKVYDNYTIQSNYAQDSYVSTMGLPIDEYGFLEI